jgi:hypothetical protein
LEITKYDDAEEYDLEREDPVFLTCNISIGSSVNKIQSMQGLPIVAVMMESA